MGGRGSISKKSTVTKGTGYFRIEGGHVAGVTKQAVKLLNQQSTAGRENIAGYGQANKHFTTADVNVRVVQYADNGKTKVETMSLKEASNRYGARLVDTFRNNNAGGAQFEMVLSNKFSQEQRKKLNAANKANSRKKK